jgi:hypothetical protein
MEKAKQSMRTFTESLEALVNKKVEIERWKAEHPEQTEIIEMVEEYTKLFDEVSRQMQLPVIMPSYPSNPVTINPGVIDPLPSLNNPWRVTCMSVPTNSGLSF